MAVHTWSGGSGRRVGDALRRALTGGWLVSEGGTDESRAAAGAAIDDDEPCSASVNGVDARSGIFVPSRTIATPAIEATNSIARATATVIIHFEEALEIASPSGRVSWRGGCWTLQR
jgi:hypothetical protein